MPPFQIDYSHDNFIISCLNITDVGLTEFEVLGLLHILIKPVPFEIKLSYGYLHNTFY